MCPYASVCREYFLWVESTRWFHVEGVLGATAAALLILLVRTPVQSHKPNLKTTPVTWWKWTLICSIIQHWLEQPRFALVALFGLTLVMNQREIMTSSLNNKGKRPEMQHILTALSLSFIVFVFSLHPPSPPLLKERTSKTFCSLWDKARGSRRGCGAHTYTHGPHRELANKQLALWAAAIWDRHNSKWAFLLDWLQ